MEPFVSIVYGRKAPDWNDPTIPAVDSPAALLALSTLSVFPAGESPLDDIPEDRPPFFIAERPNGDRFVVCTGGYNYCRYVARIPNEPDSDYYADPYRDEVDDERD